ncbi:hypothetical protein QE152_g38745 [Popillia japonica]|uniref:Uncharacterized protein n=1 Tax=Popillia japonica TaxID=7064 RepID=A0AAW1HW30_POPJA
MAFTRNCEDRNKTIFISVLFPLTPHTCSSHWTLRFLVPLRSSGEKFWINGNKNPGVKERFPTASHALTKTTLNIKSNLQCAFRRTGLYPFYPRVVPNRVPSAETRTGEIVDEF